TLKAGSPLETCTSTNTGRPSTPSRVADGTVASTALLLGRGTSRRPSAPALERWLRPYRAGVTASPPALPAGELRVALLDEGGDGLGRVGRVEIDGLGDGLPFERLLER